MGSRLSGFLNKFKQPSSWAGLGLLWSFFGPRNVPFDLVVQAGVAICALLAILLQEDASQ
jgi:hypothetical protein